MKQDRIVEAFTGLIFLAVVVPVVIALWKWALH